MNIRKGDIVGRKSYGKDILFSVKKIVKTCNGKSFAILKGLTVRIEVDSPTEDLVLIERKTVKQEIRKMDLKLERRIKNIKLF